METLKKFESPADCQTTGTVLIETGNKNKTFKSENHNQANIDGAAVNAAGKSTTATALIVKHVASVAPAAAANKLKAQQQLQLQQQYQFRAPQQFFKHKKSASSSSSTAATATATAHNATSSSAASAGNTNASATTTATSLNNNKKNKCWNKRQHRSAKQNNAASINSNNSISNNLTSSNADAHITSTATGTASARQVAVATLSAAEYENGMENEKEGETKANANTNLNLNSNLSVTAAKADLENIQNLKNQVGGHFHHHHSLAAPHQLQQHQHYQHYHNHHHGAINTNALNNIDSRMSAGQIGGFLPSCLSVMASEKLGHGHGHCKPTQQQVHKKPLPSHRSGGNGLGGGSHHHILCAGSAHNTLGAGGPGAGNSSAVTTSNLTCCHINGCSSHNTKDTSSVNNASVSSGASSLHICCLRSKFFLPDKRLRKGNFIPPTKFLLGGNISDPLNLSSLQNEASNVSSNNNTPVTTPRQSPITTPPKVEVIIPPNIHDPLHLLDPVDSMEYEKQLTSPMKRGISLQASLALGLRIGQTKTHKHRHRKNRKPKRRRYDSVNSTTSNATTIDSLDERTTVQMGNMVGTDKAVAVAMDYSKHDSRISANSADSEDDDLVEESELHSPQQKLPNADTKSDASISMQASSLATAAATAAPAATAAAVPATGVINDISFAAAKNTATENKCEVKVADHTPCTTTPAQVMQRHQELQHLQHLLQQENVALDLTSNTNTITITSTITSHVAAACATASSDMSLVTRERACRDLRLDLTAITTCSAVSTTTTSCGSSIASGGGCGGGGSAGGRKRKISESNSQKNKKYFRVDSMDKIVSPVVPQPGAWKRPPRTTASGARKSQRRSISVSEAALSDLSPTEESNKLLVEEIPRDDTPEFPKIDPFSENSVLSGSPLSAASAAISTATGEPDSVAEQQANETADNKNALILAETVKKEMISSNNSLKSLPKFTIDGKKYRYGNYDRYTGLRHLNEFMDIRLQVFLQFPELFKNKDVLDIGCNVGHMTISVARKLAPKSILGIDIDKDLIARARRNLAMYVRIPNEIVKKELADVGEMSECLPATEAKKRKGGRRRRKKKKQLQQQIHNHRHRHHHDRAHANYEHWQRFQHHLLHYHLFHHHHHHHYLYLQQESANVDASDFFPISFPITYGGITTFSALSSAANLTSTKATSPQNIESQSPASTSTTTRSTPGHPATSTASNKANTAHSTSTHRLHQANAKNEFPHNVFFRQTNYVLKDESMLANDTQQYDLILCLSITKWIHLNFGDAGLKLAFKRMFNQLRPGGKLILEAQNWASYKKKKNLTEDIYNNYHNIEFYPNKFHEYLLSTEVGFSHSYTLGIPKHLSKGFSRPIQLYAKGDYTPNHVRWSDAYYPQTPFEAYRGIYATMPSRPTGMQSSYPVICSTRSQTYDTPHYSGGGGASGPYSCRQTPMHQQSTTSQYYNPLESDSYQPSYDMEYLNHMYVFASPLYQTVWSPPTSMRKSSSHTPVFGSVRDAEFEGDGNIMTGGHYHRHVYPPNDDTSSPNANAMNAFNSIRDPDTDDSNQQRPHVYATNCGESSTSPHPNLNTSDADVLEESLMLDDDRCDLSEA